MTWLTRWFRRRPSMPAKSVFRPRVEMFEDRRTPAVLNYGGNLLTHVEAQALFLGNEWANVSTDAAQTKTLNNFLTDVTGGAYMDALSRAGYGVGRGTASAGFVDTSLTSTGTTITDASIQHSIQADIKNGSLQTPDANRLYVVYVEPNVAVNLGQGQGTTQQGILGYHGAFAGQDATGKSATIHYGVIAYPGGSVNNSSLGTTAIDQLTAVASHELAEAATDPDVNFGRLGWYDPQRGEIGDITENNPQALVRNDGYLVQEVADKNDQLLSIIPPTTPPVTPPVTPPPPTTTPPSTLTTTTTSLRSGHVFYDIFGNPYVTFTVTISPGSGNVAPDGSVQLLSNGSVIGSAHVHTVNGVSTATFTVEFLSSGTFNFSARYSGSASFRASSGSTITYLVTA